MFSSLKVKTFRIYWIGMFISLVGTWIQQVAASWLVFKLTNSAFMLGLVGFLSSVPIFFLSLFGGVLADRLNKRNILITTQIAFMILAFALAILTQIGIITPTQVMIITFLNGIVMAFDAPSRQAVVVEFVGKTHLFNAIALNSISFNSSRSIGPAIAGILIATIGISSCFYINGISFLAVIIALLIVRTDNEARVKNTLSSSALIDLKEGLVFIKNNRLILVLLSMVGVVSLFGVSYTMLMPIFANDILKVGVKGLGMLMSSAGFGALIGALILARLGNFKYKGKLFTVSAIIFSVSLMIFALSKVYWVSLVALVAVGCAVVASIATVNTILQTSVEDKFRGRVMSVFMVTFAGMMPFGSLIAGAFAQLIGASFTVAIGSIVCMLCFLSLKIVYPKISEI